MLSTDGADFRRFSYSFVVGTPLDHPPQADRATSCASRTHTGDQFATAVVLHRKRLTMEQVRALSVVPPRTVSAVERRSYFGSPLHAVRRYSRFCLARSSCSTFLGEVTSTPNQAMERTASKAATEPLECLPSSPSLRREPQWARGRSSWSR